jgi:major membrane immunogen (membrane-anchored lipoprotein)
MIREAIAICAILLLCACGAESKGDATTSSGTIQALVDGADIEFICVVDIVFS